MPQFAAAAWSSSSKGNTEICTAAGQQSSPLIVSDGAGGAIITWEDARNVHFDIFSQRIDTQGNTLWAKDGIPVCTAPENQTRPKVISDGNGGAIITWQDIRNGYNNSDIYAQRIDAAGKPQWIENGVPVCTAVNAQNSPCIASDGEGGAIIIWQDFRTNYADLYAQRITKEGEVLWKKNGDLVCGASGAQSAPVAVDDGKGGVIFAWQDFRRSFADIYAQRIDNSGKVLWEKGGVPICTALGHESFQVIVGNGSEGATIAWIDTRNGNNDIFAQQIDGNGNIRWKVNGIPVCKKPGNQDYPVITDNGAGGVILSWWDKRSGAYGIYAQHIDRDGNALWAEDGLAISAEKGIQNNVNIVSNGTGGAILTWNDNRKDPAFDVYVQQIDKDGLMQWIGSGVACSTAPDTQCFPVLVTDSAGGVIIAWQDARNRDRSYWDIYAQRINKEGSLGE
ncbi:MAG: hypothetical protein QY305_13245 [Candidatus Brocadiaceae baterium WH-1]|nr:MAG: hypothetical protein QY305_13245 [Candidatus Jettenia sp. AMX2]